MIGLTKTIKITLSYWVAIGNLRLKMDSDNTFTRATNLVNNGTRVTGTFKGVKFTASISGFFDTNKNSSSLYNFLNGGRLQTSAGNTNQATVTIAFEQPVKITEIDFSRYTVTGSYAGTPSKATNYSVSLTDKDGKSIKSQRITFTRDSTGTTNIPSGVDKLVMLLAKKDEKYYCRIPFNQRKL